MCFYKLILDFCEYMDKIIIRRATHETNSKLFDQIGVQKILTNPIIYLIKNTHDAEKKFQIFDEFVSSMSREKEFNTLSMYMCIAVSAPLIFTRFLIYIFLTCKETGKLKTRTVRKLY